MRIYLAGPMRGYNHFNFPAFDRAREWLRTEGHTVFCPAEHDREGGFDETKNSLEGFDMAAAFEWDVGAVLGADAIALLPGWEESSGATFEREVAQRSGREIFYLRPLFAGGYELRHEPMPPSLLPGKTILEEAQELVYGDREESYGHPADDFARTAQFWSGIIGEELPVWKVPLMMVALKISRECNAQSRDNIVDGAGYWATLARVYERIRRD